jgi:hypothetical protein
VPSSSKKQHNFMAAIANSPAFAKKVGIPQSVGSEFTKADKGRTFAKGGDMKESKAMVAKEMAFMTKKGAPKSMIKHEKEEAKGKPFAKGGCTKMATGGIAKANYAKGDISGKLFKASAGEGIEKGYKANTKIVKHRQGDGVAQRGLTKIGRSKEM